PRGRLGAAADRDGERSRSAVAAADSWERVRQPLRGSYEAKPPALPAARSWISYDRWPAVLPARQPELALLSVRSRRLRPSRHGVCAESWSFPLLPSSSPAVS